MSDDVETLAKIKDIEDQSSKRIDEAKAKAGKIVSDANEEAKRIVDNSVKKSDDDYNKEVEKASESASMSRTTILEGAKEKADKISDIGKDDAISIFKNIISNVYKVR